MALLVFFIYLVKIYDFHKRLEVATYFCFIFLRENKIIKKTLSMTPYLEKMVCEKPNLGLGGQVTYWEGTVKTVAPL